MSIKKYFNKTEDGSALSYLFYIMVIFFVCIIYTYNIFLTDIYLLEEHLDAAIHIATSSAISVDVSASGYNETDKILKKVKIITASNSTTTTISSQELSQVKLVYQDFYNNLSSYLYLSGSTPVKGTVYNKTSSNSKVKIKEIIIYEPTYVKTITKQDNPNPTPEEDPFVEQDFIFNISYDINQTKWIKYTITLNENNAYASTKKEILNTAPTLHDGRKAEGATIQATVTLNVTGIKKIFQDNTMQSFDISVTQATDVVLADKDNRKN